MSEAGDEDHHSEAPMEEDPEPEPAEEPEPEPEPEAEPEPEPPAPEPPKPAPAPAPKAEPAPPKPKAAPKKSPSNTAIAAEGGPPAVSFLGAPPDAPCFVPNYSAGRESRMAKELIMKSDGIIPLQNGTNKYASQKGQTGFGVPRDVVDKIKSPNLKELEGEKLNKTKEFIPLQMGTNKFDSQKGTKGFGAVRDVMYKPKFLSTEQAIPEEKARLTDGIIPSQMGTNKLASQAGMSAMGWNRPVWRKDNPEQVTESQGFLNLQMGTNKFANQNGMTGFGMPRRNLTKYVDAARGEIPHDETLIPKQSLGASTGDSQKGMGAFGSFRIQAPHLSAPIQQRLSQGFIPYQMGINWADSQTGKTPFGQGRKTVTDYVDDGHDPLPDDIAKDPNVPSWSSGYRYGASQQGMTCMGMPRDVNGKFLRRLW